VDIFFSHNSPRGIHDQEDEVHYGFDGLKTYVLQRKPRILIHGHQHVNEESKLGDTRIIGVYGRQRTEDRQQTTEDNGQIQSDARTRRGGDRRQRAAVSKKTANWAVTFGSQWRIGLDKVISR
jgi:hypothetical protein